MNREEIICEIDEAITEMKDLKDKVLIALCHAKNAVKNENDTEAYNKGLEDGRNDAWKLANKIADTLTTSERAKIFGYVVNGITVMDILRDFTPQEALAKLEAYEKKQATEIIFGDMVRIAKTDTEYIVIRISQQGNIKKYEGMSESGVWYEASEVEKTGIHVDVHNFLSDLCRKAKDGTIQV